MPPLPLGRAPCIYRHLRRFATAACDLSRIEPRRGRLGYISRRAERTLVRIWLDAMILGRLLWRSLNPGEVG